jgi:hypothetical protein
MARNEFLTKRVAFGKFTYPALPTASSTLTLNAVDTGIFLPKGAIVTAINCFSYGAPTQAGTLGNIVGSFVAGAQQIATNNRVVSAMFVQTAIGSVALASTAGVYVSVGGPLQIQMASTNTDRSGVLLDGDVYVEYLYAGDRDQA